MLKCVNKEVLGSQCVKLSIEWVELINFGSWTKKGHLVIIFQFILFDYLLRDLRDPHSIRIKPTKLFLVSLILSVDCNDCARCFLINHIFGEEISESLHRLYSAWPTRLQRGVDADVNEILLHIFDEFNSSYLIENVIMCKVICSLCPSVTKYETQTIWSFFVETEAPLSMFVSNKFRHSLATYSMYEWMPWTGETGCDDGCSCHPSA